MRDAHPYHMYESITAQPAVFASVIAENSQQIEPVRQKLRSCKRIFFVGTGTSFHAAQAGQYLFSAGGGNPDSWAMSAFNFALYPPRLSREDCVVVLSHRGTKTYSVAALKHAREAGAKTLLITGKSATTQKALADDVFHTSEQENSSAHTISYTSALAILCALAEERFDASAMAEVLQHGLGLEDKMKAVAEIMKDCRRIWIAGGGPSEISAQEIALKMKETSYMQAEGLGTETLLHGPFQSVEASDFFILIAPDGKAQERTLELIPAIKEVGAKYMVIGNEPPKNPDHWYEAPHVAEQYSTLSCLIPLQLLTYHLALVKKTNPDNFRLDDPRFAAINKFIKL